MRNLRAQFVNTCLLQVSFSIPAARISMCGCRLRLDLRSGPTTSIRAVQTIRAVQHVRAVQGAKGPQLLFLRRSPGSVPGNNITETQSCKTRTTTARPCLLLINTPCDHISASRTSSTHASASVMGLGTLRKGCCSAAAQPFSTTQCAYYRHTSDPLSLDTTDQWATPRLLLT